MTAYDCAREKIEALAPSAPLTERDLFHLADQGYLTVAEVQALLAAAE